jgi:biotin operon repressor
MSNERNHPGLFRATDILKESIPPLKWLIPGMLSAEGVTYFIGRPKLGKTNTALNIAVDIAEGKMALGSIPLEGPKGVLYCLLEGDRHRRRVHRILKDILQGRKCPDNLHIFTTETFPLMPGAIAKLDEILSEYNSIRLVIIDRFIQIRQQENQVNYHKDMADVQQIRNIAEKFNCAFLLLDHPRKLESANWIDLVSGSYGIAGTADNLLFLDRVEGSTQAKIKVQGRDVEENVFLTSFDRETKRLTVTGRGYLPDGLQEVQNVLISSPVPLSIKEIAGKLEIDPDAAKKRIKRLEDKGKVIKVDRGQYTVERPATTGKTNRINLLTFRTG